MLHTPTLEELRKAAFFNHPLLLVFLPAPTEYFFVSLPDDNGKSLQQFSCSNDLIHHGPCLGTVHLGYGSRREDTFWMKVREDVLLLARSYEEEHAPPPPEYPEEAHQEIHIPVEEAFRKLVGALVPSHQAA